MRCRRNAALVAPRPKRRLKTRSRICAVSISGDYVHAGLNSRESLGRFPVSPAAPRRQGNSLVLTVAFAHGCRQWAIRTNTVVAHPADRKAVHLRGVPPSEHVADQFSQSLSFRW